jgi:hypothetical protein
VLGRSGDSEPRCTARILKHGSPSADDSTVALLPASTRVTTSRRRACPDAGAILVSTLTKVLLALAIVGTIGYDSLSVLTSQYRVRDDAVSAAQAGHDVLHNTGRKDAAAAAVVKYAEEHGDIIVKQGPAPGKQNGWYVSLRREARTIVTGYLPKLKDSVIGTAESTASDPLPAA